MKKIKIFFILFILLQPAIFAAGGLPTFDITAMLNWITEFATNTEDKIKEKVVWAEDIKTAMEHYKEIQNYWEQMKGISQKFSMDGVLKGLELAGKIQQEGNKMIQDADDVGKGFEAGLEETWDSIEKITSGDYFNELEADFNAAYSHTSPEERFSGIMKTSEKGIKDCDSIISDADKGIKLYGEGILIDIENAGGDSFTVAKKMGLKDWQKEYEKMYSTKSFFDIQASKKPYAIKKEMKKSQFEGNDDIEMYVKEVDTELSKIDELNSISETAAEIQIDKYMNKEAYNVAAVSKVALYNMNAAETETAKKQWETIKIAADKERESFEEQAGEFEEKLEDFETHIKECKHMVDKWTEAKKVAETKKEEFQKDYNIAKERLERYQRSKN